MKRAQIGSAGPMIVLLVVGGLLWWKWDKISAYFRSSTQAGGGVVAEVLDYRCDVQPNGEIIVKGSLRNVSDTAVGLWAVNALHYDKSDIKSIVRQAPVKPASVAPGAIGTFQIDAPALSDSGTCKLTHFLDSSTSKALGYTGGGEARPRR